MPGLRGHRACCMNVRQNLRSRDTTTSSMAVTTLLEPGEMIESPASVSKLYASYLPISLHCKNNIFIQIKRSRNNNRKCLPSKSACL